ncbi:hypothetical protein DBR06_SOUSAS5610041, partial [Sousa chinensis]
VSIPLSIKDNHSTLYDLKKSLEICRCPYCPEHVLSQERIPPSSIPEVLINTA